MKCENKNRNDAVCTCSYPGCPRHGLCCECVAYHLRAGEIPGCFFTPAGEKTWDRSFEALKRDREKN